MMHCMTARKIKQLKLQSCQIWEAREDASNLTGSIHRRLGSTAGNSAQSPTEQMPSGVHSGGWDLNPDFWPLGPLKISSDTFCKLILSFLKSTPVTLLAITKQNPTGLQSSCISKNEAFGEFLNRAALVFLLFYWQIKHLWLENWAVRERLLHHPSGKQSPLLSIPNHLRTPVGTTAFQQLRSYWQTRFVNHQTTKSP